VDEPDLRGLVPPIARATGPLGYVRLHGRNKENWWTGMRGFAGSEPGPGARPGDGPRQAGDGPRRADKRSRTEADYGPLFSTDTAAADALPKPRPSGDRYDYLYSEAELKEWVGKIRELSTKAKKTFVFFNNCHVGQAATGAKLMRRLLEGEGLL